MAEQPERLPEELKYDPGTEIGAYLHDGEPFFLLRAQDALSLGVLAYYKLAAEATAAPNAQSVGAMLVRFAEWQRAHDELVKLPD